MSQSSLTNSAQIKYQYETLGTTIESETQTNYVSTNIIEPKLNILKTSCLNYFGPNDKITYNLYLSNNALSTIYDINISEIIDTTFTYINDSALATYSNGSTIHLQNSNSIKSNSSLATSLIYDNKSEPTALGFKIENLDAGSNIMLSYSISLNPDTDIPDTINSYSVVQYSQNANSTQYYTIKSNICTVSKSFALLNVSSSVDKENAFCGDTICYKINLKNSGNLDAVNVHISDQLPSKFTFKNVKFKIADLPYNISFNVDKNNLLTIPSQNTEQGLCIPSNTDDNYILIYGTINND